MAIRGLLPLSTVTIQGFLRAELATGCSNGAGSKYGIAASRVHREFAEEIALATGSPTQFPPLTPMTDVSLGQSRLRLRPYAWFDATWRGGKVATWGDQPRVGIAGTLHLSPHLTLQQDLFAGDVPDGLQFGDALVNHTDFILFVESVGVTYARAQGFLRLGRFRNAWGPGRTSHLLLASTAQPFGQLEYGLVLGDFRFRALSGILDPTSEKNIALHRLEWSPHPRWLLSVSEGAVFHGSPAQPLYALGLVPYSILDRVAAQDVYRTGDLQAVRNNVLVQADVLVRVLDSSALWGEMLIDDVGTESSTHPTRLGFLVGAETEQDAGDGEWNLGLELAKVYNYVYSVYYEDSDWSHQARPIGFELGPDTESGWIFLHWSPAVTWEVGVDLALERRGEGRIGNPWTAESDPSSGGDSPTSPSSLSGTVERRTSGSLSLVWSPTGALRVELRGTRAEFRDLENQAGAKGDDNRIDLTARWHR